MRSAIAPRDAVVRFGAEQAAALWATAAPGQFEMDGVAVDSRRVRPGNLFVALRGERVDGHDFIGHAIRSGARAALASRRPAGGEPCFLVEDPLASLQRLASHWRRRSGFRLAVVTGSSGKTTTKEMAGKILARVFRACATEGNYNSTIGFPMALMNVEDGLEAVAGEMGMSHAGELSALSRLFEPDAAAVTNVSEAHAENFPSPSAIADAKWEIVEGLKPGGTLVYNQDDPELARRAERHAGRKISFGYSAESDVRAAEVEPRGLEGSAFTLEVPGDRARVELPLAGRYEIANCLCAAALAFSLGVGAAQVARAAPEFEYPERRGRRYRLASGALLVDDSYNASPASVKAALDTLSDVRGGRRIAVLGDLRELGRRSGTLCRQVGAHAASRVDRLVCVGPLGREIGRGAEAAGLAAGAVLYLNDAAEVAPAIFAELRSGDVVWVKGSRAARLDIASDALRA
jgi:UDP-N-acetylmuramoyl-tripeptide--D-alanyl-D-alanine ligase